MGDDGQEAIPALSAALKDEDADVRQYAANALGHMGPAAQAAVPALSEALSLPRRDSPDCGQRRAQGYLHRPAAAHQPKAQGKPPQRGQQPLRTQIARVPVDPDAALRQHMAYCQMLRDSGAHVVTLDNNRDWPDSTFIEDTAVVLDEVAVLASMGTEARRGEVAGIESELKKYRELHRIKPPATLEGGDVLRVGRTVLVGVSSRTNLAGVHAFEAVVRQYGYRVSPVPVPRCLHLKSACTALPDGSLLVNRSWLDTSSLLPFELVPIPEEEPWAANTLRIGETICLAANHVRTAELLRQRGFAVRTVQVSEFAKLEGGVTCLSLRFATRNKRDLFAESGPID
jgi:dimethylargininase